jgi:hypothetical protein
LRFVKVRVTRKQAKQEVLIEKANKANPLGFENLGKIDRLRLGI